MKARLKFIALIAICGVIPFAITACGGDDDKSATTPETTTAEAGDTPGAASQGSDEPGSEAGAGNSGQQDGDSSSGSGTASEPGGTGDGQGAASGGNSSGSAGNNGGGSNSGGSGGGSKPPNQSGGSGKSTSPRSAEEAAAIFVAALKQRNARRLCENFSPSYIKKTSKSMKNCVSSFTRLLKNADTRKISTTPGKVKVNGDRATAELIQTDGKSGGMIQMVRENGRWYATLSNSQ